MATQTLNAVKAGITRLRTKGGASPDSLFDLVNGYVTLQRTIRMRPGTPLVANIPTGVFNGICSFKGKIIFFANVVTATPSPLFQCAVIVHPTDASKQLLRIHRAGPYAGALYVVAEFEDNSIFHYWLEESRVWDDLTTFLTDQVVLPTVPNGLAYRAQRRGSSYPAWAPNVPRAVGDKVEPTVYTGYFYEVTAVAGTNPSSGAVEPTWPTSEGGQVIEDTDGGSGSVDGSTPVTTTPELPGTPGPGETDPDPYCVVEDTWLSPSMQAKDYTVGMMADLHTPELGYYRGPCVGVARALVPCVRLVFDGCSKTVSRTTPVNHYEALADLADGTWDFAPNLRPGTLIRVGFGPERLREIIDVGEQWVMKLSFDGASYAGSDQRLGPRVYTHNARIVK